MIDLDKIKQLTILIVDDNIQNIHVLHSVLSNRGYKNIAFATSGEQALANIQNTLPDLIFLDIVMPDMDGYEVLKKLKSQNYTKDIPVMFLTTKGYSSDMVKGFKLGAVDYIIKPFENEILLAKVNTYLTIKYQTRLLTNEKQLLKEAISAEIKKRLQSSVKLEALYKNSSLGISFIDTNEKIMDANETFIHMLGYSKHELLLTDVSSLTCEEDRAYAKEAFNKIINADVKSIVFNKRYIKKDGSIVWFHTTLTRLDNIANDNDIVVASICEDLTEKLNLEEELKAKEQILMVQSRLAKMGEMISMIAHQWRQPLASISAISGTLTLDIMMDNYNDKYFQERLESIGELSQHLSKTIDDFRGFFKEDKEEKISKIGNIIEDSITIIGQILISESINLSVEYIDNPKIKSHLNELKQVILNLLKNAEDILLENNIQEAKIWIKVYVEDSSACISIEDNAGGVPEDIMDKVFDPYFSTKKEKEGTGLGLYMSKTIIEEHCAGKLLLHNTNNGASFTIKIPLFYDEED